MIQSLKRLVRQMWVGARPAPASEALMMTPEDVATFSAQAKIRRENLKRAMETAFASAPAPVVVDEPVLVLDASIAVAEAAAEQEREIANEDMALAIDAQAVRLEEPATVLETEKILDQSVQEAVVVQEIEEPVVASAVPDMAVVEGLSDETLFDADAVAVAGYETAVEPELLELAVSDGASGDVLTELLPDETMADVVAEPAEEAAPEALAIEEPVAEMPAETVYVVEGIAEPEVSAVVEEAAVDEIALNAAAPDVMESEFVPLAQAEDALEEAVAEPIPASTKKAAPKKKAAAAPKKKAASKKKAQTLDDDVWVSDAVAFSLNGAWPEAWEPPVDEAGAARLEEFRTKAAEGVITIWGRTSAEGTWEPIKATYWKSGTVEPMSFVEGREHVATEGKKGKGKAPAVYSALKISKAQVEALWGGSPAH